MIGFTPKEFEMVQEGIAAAHLFNQAVCPLLKQRRVALNKDQRNLLDFAPNAVADAYHAISLITHREKRDPASIEAQAPTEMGDIDVLAMRDELENVSALMLPDLLHHMAAVLEELPMFRDQADGEKVTARGAPLLMAWCWEAGRRYGLQQAMAIFENTSTDFKAGTQATMESAMDGPLRLPSPEAAAGASEISRANDRPGPTLVKDDGRSTWGYAVMEYLLAQDAPRPTADVQAALPGSDMNEINTALHELREHGLVILTHTGTLSEWQISASGINAMRDANTHAAATGDDNGEDLYSPKKPAVN